MPLFFVCTGYGMDGTVIGISHGALWNPCNQTFWLGLLYFGIAICSVLFLGQLHIDRIICLLSSLAIHTKYDLSKAREQLSQ